MKRSPVRSRSWASISARPQRPLDEPEAARDPGVDAGSAQATGKDPGADRADQARAVRSARHQRAAAVSLTRGRAEGEAAAGAAYPLPERADHRVLDEAPRLAVLPVAL